MYDISINSERSINKNILITTRPSVPAPERNIEYKEIPGRNGSLMRDYKTYKDIEIDIEFNFISNQNKWLETMREVKRWLANANNKKLEFSDDPDFFMIIKQARVSSSERVARRFGRFTATFRCEPFMYLLGSDEFITAEERIYNDFSECQPIYKITGEGKCTLTVNGNEMLMNIGQFIIIDTMKQIAYRGEEPQNTSVSGDFNTLHLLEGDNILSVTDGFKLEIAPYFRSI